MTVIIDRQVLDELKQQGVSSFPIIVEAAIDSAQEVDWQPKQVAVLKDTPILHTMVARFRRHGIAVTGPQATE